MSYFGGSLEDLDFVALGSAAPVGAGDIAAIEGEGVTAAGGLPSQTIVGKPALSRLLREVEVDVVEVFTTDKKTLGSAHESGDRQRADRVVRIELSTRLVDL